MATVATMQEKDIFDLLRQAEERLEAGSNSVVPSTSRPTLKSDAAAAVPFVQAPAAQEEKTVREPVVKSKSATKKKDSAGSDWFDLPKTVNTNEFKRDWQILRMRGVLDPKHQKKTLRAEVPKYSQVGEIVAGPTDYFSGRLTRRERRQNLVEEAMRDYNDEKFKAKYGAIQEQKMSGKKNFYKKLMAQRRKRG